ncbi:MAG: 4Fe-4S dicluster domain-containing protein [Halodesulfovibrio sp.]
MAKKFFVDLTRCTACRGCQIACKQWKKLPAEKTVNTGSHQNPADLSYETIRLVRFKEIVHDGKLDWLFFPEQCRHCVVPPCKGMGDLDDPTAILQDPETGAVVYTDKTRLLDFSGVRSACPYDIPRQDPETKRINKCDMCIDRIHNGMKPACVHTCPTGTMNFGEEDEIMAMAEARLKEVQQKYPKAVLGDPHDVRVVYLFHHDPMEFFERAVSELTPHLMTRKQMFARIMGHDRNKNRA